VKCEGQESKFIMCFCIPFSLIAVKLDRYTIDSEFPTAKKRILAMSPRGQQDHGVSRIPVQIRTMVSTVISERLAKSAMVVGLD
jgi:hypothetical protein